MEMTDKSAMAQEHERAKERDDPTCAANEELQKKYDNLRYDPVMREYQKIRTEMNDYRQACLNFLHPLVVNNASNIYGGIEVASEFAMFKANGTVLITKPHGMRNPLDYVIEPPKSVVRAIFDNAKFTKVEGEQWHHWLRPDKLWNRLTDLKAATEREWPNALKNVDPKTGMPKLVNRWQARAGFSSIIPFALVAVLPDAKDDEKDVEEMTRMSKENPLGYLGLRVYQGINPLEWGEHKRQLGGLGKLAAGIFTMVAGFRNPGKAEYVTNTAHAIGGAITALAGTQLMFAVDNQSGWSQFGSTLWARMFVLPKSIMNRYQKGDPNANWYSLAHLGFQTGNTEAFLIGGAHKLPDGTIVDAQEMRTHAKQLLAEERNAKKQDKDDTKPTKKITEPQHNERVAEATERQQGNA